ncbi:TetR family transcriptional regulator [Streptomyces cinnamoneus]|uniref:TetR family transcriptional regulator n=1 Tax=Streptomyces cinnamoneus TaxID=53446 RepID=A0A2G1XFP3_STRCJ|nr:TetR family transcriptional regulator C-terminal domain-containing protein [Streptomyces cinnamoneus]PHQ49959.1 TetR family transcriptional regulator [Streptomyces cinnamoneus]PPT13263.1 TetR family transcriptional regulator [Streptomyces cinnamoneus]
MPKRVDRDERRHRIAEALWRIACDRGLDGASLRDVAAEAGISLGQLQHYFRSKDEMLLFALDHIGELATRRIRARLEALPGVPAPRTLLRETMTEILPLDDRRRSGQLVEVAYVARAVHDERLRRRAQEGTPMLRTLLAGWIGQAVDRGEVAADRDPAAEAMALLCLVDGLTTYVLLEVLPPAEATALLDAHLDRLFSTPPSDTPHPDTPRSDTPRSGTGADSP